MDSRWPEDRVFLFTQKGPGYLEGSCGKRVLLPARRKGIDGSWHTHRSRDFAQGHRLAYAESVLDTNIWRMEGPAEPGIIGPKLIALHAVGRGCSCIRRMVRKSLSHRIGQGALRSGYVIGTGLNAVQLTYFSGPLTGAPQWSPDGRNITFDSRPGAIPTYMSSPRKEVRLDV